MWVTQAPYGVVLLSSTHDPFMNDDYFDKAIEFGNLYKALKKERHAIASSLGERMQSEGTPSTNGNAWNTTFTI